MMALNPDQFFSGLDDFDKEHPTSAYTANKDSALYHGTTHIIKDKVLPADAANKNVSDYSMGDPGDMSEGDHAFATKDEGYAWHAAGTFHKNGRRPRVYEVAPAHDMEPGPWNKDHPDFLHHAEYGDPEEYPPHENKEAYDDAIASHHQPEFGSKSGFPVKKRIDIMPGRQGTFPDVNWNRFKKDASAEPTGSREQMFEASRGPDVNHPSDRDVKFGTGKTALEVHRAALNENQFGHDWSKDPAPHSELREAAGRPQKRWATLLD